MPAGPSFGQATPAGLCNEGQLVRGSGRRGSSLRVESSLIMSLLCLLLPSSGCLLLLTSESLAHGNGCERHGDPRAREKGALSGFVFADPDSPGEGTKCARGESQLCPCPCHVAFATVDRPYSSLYVVSCFQEKPR